MTSDTDAPTWELARLIPVSGIRNIEEQERRATSALLAVLSAVDEFGVAITKPLGAPKGKMVSYIEVPFDLADGRSVRPDGLIQVKRGKKSWTALLEIKTGNSELKREQIETYLDIAKEQNFDCVITISNQIAKIPGQHPVEVDKRKIRKVALYHMSWSRVLTESVLQGSHRGVADQNQAWILGELIRYLEHPNAGSMDFCDMGEYWVGVRDSVKNGTLRRTDRKAMEVAGKWEELVTFAVLTFGRKLGTAVQEILSGKERNDIGMRITNIVGSMVTKGIMPAIIRIPNTVGDISLNVDLRAQQVVASISVKAPATGRTKTRINWLLRQLNTAPAGIRIDSWGQRSRTSMSDLLGSIRQKPNLLEPLDNRELISFTVSLSHPMGLKRTMGNKSFIDSVLKTLDIFYGEVVQHLREWQPSAPRLQNKEMEKEYSDSPDTAADTIPEPTSDPADIPDDSPNEAINIEH